MRRQGAVLLAADRHREDDGTLGFALLLIFCCLEDPFEQLAAVLSSGSRGQRTYAIDGKNAKMTVAGAEVSAKSRWDKAVLRQEFSTPSSKLIQTWDVDDNGRLVLVAKVESLKLVTPDQKAVFDKK